MAMVAHLVGIEQLGYEKELGMTPSVSIYMNHKNATIINHKLFIGHDPVSKGPSRTKMLQYEMGNGVPLSQSPKVTSTSSPLRSITCRVFDGTWMGPCKLYISCETLSNYLKRKFR